MQGEGRRKPIIQEQRKYGYINKHIISQNKRPFPDATLLKSKLKQRLKQGVSSAGIRNSKAKAKTKDDRDGDDDEHDGGMGGIHYCMHWLKNSGAN